jgi:hypothetical protein
VIPDICGAMESSDGRATSTRYAEWFDVNIAPNYPALPDGSPFFSGADCYRLRCSFLHQGSTQHPKSDYSRVIFTEPASNTFHMNIVNDALNIDIRQFCREMADAALTWLPAAEATENFQRNFPKFMQRYPEGLAPYMVGMPLIS